MENNFVDQGSRAKGDEGSRYGYAQPVADEYRENPSNKRIYQVQFWGKTVTTFTDDSDENVNTDEYKHKMIAKGQRLLKNKDKIGKTIFIPLNKNNVGIINYVPQLLSQENTDTEYNSSLDKPERVTDLGDLQDKTLLDINNGLLIRVNPPRETYDWLPDFNTNIKTSASRVALEEANSKKLWFRIKEYFKEKFSYVTNFTTRFTGSRNDGKSKQELA